MLEFSCIWVFLWEISLWKMLHFQISRSSVEIVGSASSVWISLWPVLHQAPLLGALHSSGDPVCGGVASGQWSVVSPDAVTLDTGGCSEAGRGWGGSAGQARRTRWWGEGWRDGEGCSWRLEGLGWALQNAWLQKQVLLASGSGPAAEETLARHQPRLPRPGAVHCTAATCVPARTTHRRNPPPVFAHGGVAQLCAEYPRHEVLRAAAASLSPPGRCPHCLLETSCFYFVRESVKLLLRLCRNESYMNRDDVR